MHWMQVLRAKEVLDWREAKLFYEIYEDIWRSLESEEEQPYISPYLTAIYEYERFGVLPLAGGVLDQPYEEYIRLLLSYKALELAKQKRYEKMEEEEAMMQGQQVLYQQLGLTPHENQSSYS